VESVILTHHHGDHAGSIAEVLAAAVNATAWAGEADIASISGADLSPLVGGEDVFGMEILATPGHTAGHMATIDHGAGLLIAGDALTIDAGAAAEPPAQFTADGDQARATIEMLARLSFNTLLVGHGDPIESGADASVAALAASF
jgi:glyoxylase-like metal-dependent hydrolase (beta-lactamase superfamily II)